ncbi:patatin-like phospholipase family protein [Kineococcus sp. SYSU DK001]|uniref:patatin-like phospholipase family protein n=1 Tax=Kineococcus sp. SYSU DK001 TaxID=3383122 RepID=UPI003D7E8AE7
MSGGAPGRPRRSLVLAGGGTKVAFQAGVLQVWLDEAGLDFDHADGASGGVFNLAMWAQGMTGHQIAENWRHYRPLSAVQPNVRGLAWLPGAPSLFRLDRLRSNTLREWGLDWSAIRATPREATFNLYDFTRLEAVVSVAADMDEDRLVSAVSLPGWFPPVDIDGHTYIDAVYATDANLEEGIRRGADELWVIWTVSARGTWRNGPVSQYFQVIEAAATSQLRSVLRRIEVNNDAVERSGQGAGEFGRTVRVRLLQAEVPAHYLFNFRRDRIAMAVELGVQTARRWCAAEKIALSPPAPGPSAARSSGLSFTEVMAGPLGVGEQDPVVGARVGDGTGDRITFRLTIIIDDLDAFVRDPRHEATASGWVECFGGRFDVQRGWFNLFVDQDDPARKRMLYRLCFNDFDGQPLTLLGHKVVTDDAGLDSWPDTTTLYARVLRGHADWNDPAPVAAAVIAAGVLRITPRALARQLTTFRGHGGTAWSRANALARFARLFTGQLWDVYVSPSAPPLRLREQSSPP